MALSWIGTGRLIFSLNYTEADFEAVADRFIAAAKAMHSDGWWWAEAAANHQAPDSERDDSSLACKAPLSATRLSNARLAALLPRLRNFVETPIRAMRHMTHGIDQLTFHEIERRLVVEHDVVERIGHDLGHPYQACLDILQKEQVNRAKQKATQPDRQPHQARHCA